MDSRIDERLADGPASSSREFFAAGTPITWGLPIRDDPTLHMIRSGKTVTATLPWARLPYRPGDGMAHTGRGSLPPVISYHMTCAILTRHCSSRRWPMSCGCGGSGVRGPVHHSRHLVAFFDTGLGETGRKMGEILATRRNEGGKSVG